MLYLEKLTLDGTSYPCKIKKEVLSTKLSYEKLLQNLKEDLSSKTPAYRYHIHDGTNYSFFEAFNPQGKTLTRSTVLTQDEVFLGEDNPRFALGELVEFISVDELLLGFVTAQPPTTKEVKSRKWKLDNNDNVYLVDLSDDTSDHAHPSSSLLQSPSLPVSEEERRRLWACHEKVQESYKKMKQG